MAMAGMGSPQMSLPARTLPTMEPWPHNASLVLVRRDGPVGAFNLASIALLGGAAAFLLGFCAWLLAMEVKVRRQRERWRPRVPPRPSRLLLLSPADGEEGYVEPHSPPFLSSGSPSASAACTAHATRAHSYLLVVANEPPAPYEEVVFPSGAAATEGITGKTAGTPGVYLRPRLITSKQQMTDEGYLPMRGRHLPSIIKVLKNGELAIDLHAVYDEYLHMAPGTQPPSDGNQPPLTPKMAVSAGMEIREEKELQSFHVNAGSRVGSVHSYEAVRPTPASPRLPTSISSIQSRVLPPLPPHPLPQRPGARPPP